MCVCMRVCACVQLLHACVCATVCLSVCMLYVDEFENTCTLHK